jgi:2-keto-4-pentenoate hydratase
MAVEGEPLVAGDIVMTGALGPMVDLPVGTAASVTISGLGTVRTHHQARS